MVANPVNYNIITDTLGILLRFGQNYALTCARVNSNVHLNPVTLVGNPVTPVDNPRQPPALWWLLRYAMLSAELY
jgi:hypothetical protein